MSSELLKQIQAGKNLKKAKTNDRSAPVIDSSISKPSSAPISSGGTSAAGRPPQVGGPPQLGGLFAGGMPKLKPAGQNNLGEHYQHLVLW
jgi:WAS/WASL-interacting protein